MLVKCVDKLEKRISVFKADENETSTYYMVTIPLQKSKCFIEQPIELVENETLNISAENPDEITSITFAAPSTLPEIPLVIFEQFSNLSEVHFVFTGIEVIEEDDFLNATELRRLRLELNNIKQISKSAFSKAIKLEQLELPANGIQSIDDFAFTNLQNLTKLDLQQNNLTILHEHIFSGVINLVELYLNDNQIDIIEDGALYFEKLARLYLQDNRLKSLSPNVLTGTPLLYGIDLSRNQLELVVGIFDKCPNLTIIGLNHNKIESIDLIELANHPSLMVLSLEGNNLDISPNATTNQTAQRQNLLPFKTQLKYLNLGSNSLSSPDILKQLDVFRRLKFLDLSDNEFTSIDGLNEIRTLFPHFIQLNMNQNPLHCTWLEDILPFMKHEGILFQTTKIESDKDGNDSVKRNGNNDTMCPTKKPISPSN